MNTPCNLPYFEIEAGTDGSLLAPAELQQVVGFLTSHAGAVKDLFVMSHGWNNDMNDARSLYERFFTEVCNVIASHAAAGVSAAQCAVVGILWPSKKFADSSVIPGGAAAVDNDAALLAALDHLAEAAGPEAAGRIAAAKAAVPTLEDNPAAQRAFVDSLRPLVPATGDPEEGAQLLFSMPGDDMLDLLAKPVPTPAASADSDADSGDIEGGAQGLSSFFSDIKTGAMRLLNVTTYYIMKDRAGAVGRGAVAQALNTIQGAFPALRIHLIGHSFGCRVVTSAVAAAAHPVASMTLLQAAFSHNSFSPDFDDTHKPGGFRSVVEEGKVAGPIAISHTVKDEAVGLAYAIASRLARQNASAIGDANDPYGGLGRNGAQHTPEARDGMLLSAGQPYTFAKISNLNGDAIIMGHSDITRPETAWAACSAAGLVR